MPNYLRDTDMNPQQLTPAKIENTNEEDKYSEEYDRTNQSSLESFLFRGREIEKEIDSFAHGEERRLSGEMEMLKNQIKAINKTIDALTKQRDSLANKQEKLAAALHQFYLISKKE